MSDRQLDADQFASSLMSIARKQGEPAIDRAIAAWDAPAETKRLLNPVLVQNARNEARQIGNEVWARELRAKKKWGV
jgi:hypothetical protein